MADHTYIAVDTGMVLDAAQALRRAGNDLDDKLDVLRERLLKDLVWDTPDSKIAYETQQKIWDDAVREMNKLLMQVGAKLGDVGQNYIDQELNLTKMWS